MASPKLQPLPQTSEETEMQTERKEHRMVDISASFTKDALRVLEEASLMAYSSGSGEATPYHLFSALAKRTKLINGLSSHSLDALKKATTELSQLQITDSFKTSGLVFFSPDLKKVLFGAYFLAKQEGINDVTDKHLMLALQSLPDFSPVLSDISFGSSSVSPQAFVMPSFLAKYAKDLSSTTINTSFFGREQELEQILRILSRENKHHVLLLGDAGVGKTALGMGLVKLLAERGIPSFAGVKVLSLDLGSLFSSPQNVQFFAPKIIEEVGTLPKIIILLDQVTLLNSTQQVSMMVTFLQNLDKQAQVYYLLPVTPFYYNQTLASNPYFSSYFETIKVEEFPAEATIKVLEAQALRIEKYHKVNIDKNVFSETIILAKRYLPGTLPQKAIALLEEASASASLSKRTAVTIDDIKSIVAQKTGIPLQSLTVSEKEKLQQLEKLLGLSVIGQKEAIVKVSEALRRARSGLKDPKKPIGSFLFLGPTGVGKTELAKTLARVFFDDEKAFLRLDMSEYAEAHTSQRLIGSPPGYVGYEEGGQLTNPVMEKPYSLILLDEIEKAHPRVFDLFLQVLDEGRLTDAQGKTVDFKNSLLIFTSNIAAEEIFKHGTELVNPDFDRKAFFEKEIMPVIRQYFRPEFINRFDDLVLFNPLTKAELIEIARLKIQQLEKRMAEKKIMLDVSDEKLKHLVEISYNPSFGARPLERAIREQVENVIANKIISGEIKEGDIIKW